MYVCMHACMQAFITKIPYSGKFLIGLIYFYLKLLGIAIIAICTLS